jgi:hypothetical protein
VQSVNVDLFWGPGPVLDFQEKNRFRNSPGQGFCFVSRFTLLLLTVVSFFLFHTVVLYYVLARDGEGKSFIPKEVGSILSESANAPVYGCLDSYLGDGIVGGRMTSMEMTGVKAGEIGLRILRGENPSDIPMSGQGTIVDMFDWRQLKRWGISEDKLPPRQHRSV